jgi:dual specificity protein kinase YAK1
MNTALLIMAFRVLAEILMGLVQARTEIGILSYLNSRMGDFLEPGETCPIVQMKDFFKFRSHVCLVFELLNVNLYELIKSNEHRGLSWNLVKIILKQVCPFYLNTRSAANYFPIS